MSARIPTATYRLQMSPDFGFERARAALGYLERLGVSDLYLSPVMQAVSSSSHGYDVTDPTRVDERLGGLQGFRELALDARERGMGMVLDFVPNHMAASVENPWWSDVLLNGADSRYSKFFDIDWKGRADGKLLLPVLGDPLDQVLQRGELAIDGAELVYYERRLPLAAGSIGKDVRETIARQHYRPDHWRLQATELNYRRFFDISDLVALRVELEEVFDEVHSLLLELIAAGLVTGVRIDHVDGLADPAGYLQRLQRAAGSALGVETDMHGRTPDGQLPLFVLVEKILEPGERLPGQWPVHGTTGYDFLPLLDGLFLTHERVDAANRAYELAGGHGEHFEQVARAAKLQIMQGTFPGEVDALACRIHRAAAPQSVSEPDVREALIALTAGLDVYRTYVGPDGPSAADVAAIDAAAMRARDSADPRAIELVRTTLLRHPALAMRWQQLSGPVMAKSIEDTAFYRHVAIPSANEVGGHPSAPAVSVADFHEQTAARARDWPHTMNAASTHDTKRSADVRLRMAAMVSHPERWSLLTGELIAEAAAAGVDERAASLALWTVVATWPLQRQRLDEYLVKAAREAKRQTSWTDPNEHFENRLTGWADTVLQDERVVAAAREIAAEGDRLSLAAVAIRLTAPGVPDIYQADESRFLALVDPDNRRPVPIARMSQQLGTLQAPNKLTWTNRLLQLRAAHPGLFRDGAYLAIPVQTPRVLAFARTGPQGRCLTVAHLDAQRPTPDGVLELPQALAGSWTRVLADEPDLQLRGSVDLDELLRGTPAQVLLQA